MEYKFYEFDSTVIPSQNTEPLHPPTQIFLKFGTNVPLHELGRCAKSFHTKPNRSDFRGWLQFAHFASRTRLQSGTEF